VGNAEIFTKEIAAAPRGLTNRSSGRVGDKMPSSNVGERVAQLNR
jgi:hypothetical protein